MLGKDFAVNYVANLRDSDAKEDLYGETDGRARFININASHTREEQESTLFHESVHAALAVAGLDHILSEKTEEALVTCIEHAFSHIVDVYKLGIDTETQI